MILSFFTFLLTKNVFIYITWLLILKIFLWGKLKCSVVYINHCWCYAGKLSVSVSVADRRATTSLSTSHKAHERPYYTYIVLPWPHTCNVRVVQGLMVGRVHRLGDMQQRYKFHNPSSPSNTLSGLGKAINKQTHPWPQARIWTSTSSPTLKAVLLFLLNQGGSWGAHYEWSLGFN